MSIYMDAKKLGAAIILVLILAAAAVAFSLHKGTSTRLINSSTVGRIASQTGTPTNQTGTNSSKVLFSSTPYSQYSYVVYPGPISSQAQAALTGFNLTSTPLQNSSTDIRLALIGTNQYQTLTLKPNYKLYIIETTFGDDGYHFDSSLGDDGFVVVDPKGYVA